MQKIKPMSCGLRVYMNETLALCEHHVPIKFGCALCNNKRIVDSIDECRKRLDELEVAVKDIKLYLMI